MKRALLIAIAALAALCAQASAEVVQAAPNFTWTDASGKTQSLLSFKGQPVVLIVAPSPTSWAFRSQVGALREMYEQLAAHKTIFVAAFTQAGGMIKSNIPFVIASDGPRVAYDYHTAPKFGVAVIGRDGNLDYLTSKVLPVQRIYDVIDNSYVSQEALRRP